VYRIKIKIAGKLGELLTQGKGHVVHTSQGDVCVFRSLVHAQYAANLLARYGLLGCQAEETLRALLHATRSGCSDPGNSPVHDDDTAKNRHQEMVTNESFLILRRIG